MMKLSFGMVSRSQKFSDLSLYYCSTYATYIVEEKLVDQSGLTQCMLGIMDRQKLERTSKGEDSAMKPGKLSEDPGWKELNLERSIR